MCRFGAGDRTCDKSTRMLQISSKTAKPAKCSKVTTVKFPSKFLDSNLEPDDFQNLTVSFIAYAYISGKIFTKIRSTFLT